MAATRTKRLETCTHENCGSRRFHLGDDGFTYCDQGHQQSERGTVISEDTGEYVVQGTVSRKRDSDGESTTSKASGFSGSRAFEHYLLCIQLVLRKQIRWLVEAQKLPVELETLVRDLWALRLQRLRDRISREPGAESEPESSQFFSSQSESETLTGSQSRSSRRTRRNEARLWDHAPALTETLCFCYIGIILLRTPVTVGDIHKWINDGELLYYRATREIPLGMRVRLPGSYQELLEPQDLLQPQVLHKGIMDILGMLRGEFGMLVPPINTSLVLFRWIQGLALPLEIFSASQRLAKVLDIDGDFSPGGKNIVLRYPEVRLMALLLIATKLVLPLDKIERHPQSLVEMSGLSMDWDAWAEAHENADERPLDGPGLKFEEAFDFKESDCIEANSQTLDAYLDWYSDNIATEEIRQLGQAGRDADFRKALFTMFPIHRERPPRKEVHKVDLASKIRNVQSTLRPRSVVEDVATDDLRRPGSFYRRFRSEDQLSGPVRIFFQKAATLAGLSLDDMVQAVFLTELKLGRQEDALRKGTRV